MGGTSTSTRLHPRPRALALALGVLLPAFAGAVLVSGLGPDGTTSTRPAFAGDEIGVRTHGVAAQANSAAVVDFSELARQESLNPAKPVRHALHRPLPRPDTGSQEAADEHASAESIHNRHKLKPRATFSGSGYSGWIPPDTMGAVGPNNLMETLNGQVQIMSRTGSLAKSVTLLNFWSSVGGLSEVFDPRVLYDPYSDRWIASAGANPQSASAAILVGVSQTGDPAGAWNLYKVAADPTAVNWGDAPTLGSNANWIVVQANMFTVSTSSFSSSTLFVFNKANLYAAGSGLYTKIAEPSGFTDFPANTYDNTLSAMYLVESYGGGTGRLRVSTITGPVGAEVLATGVAFPTATSTWHSSAAITNFAPQLGTSNKIDTDDDRIEGCVYRNNSIWVSHTVFLPASSTPTRSSAQWWEIDASAGNIGNVLQFGRVDDPSNNTFYAYPSIAVNVNDDVMLGFSEFSASIYASAAYAFRYGTDPANSMGPVTLLKSGLASYYQDFGTGDNRWGDYSATVVDPVNDTDLWTLQEYAGTNNNWGTWWGNVSPLSSSGSSPTPTATATATPTPAPSATATATATATTTPTPTPTPVPLTITTSTLPSGKVGARYLAAVQASGGAIPYSFKVSSGSLPPGVSLASGGSLSGTPTASGKFGFKITVTDTSGGTSSKNYQVRIGK